MKGKGPDLNVPASTVEAPPKAIPQAPVQAAPEMSDEKTADVKRFSALDKISKDKRQAEEEAEYQALVKKYGEQDLKDLSKQQGKEEEVTCVAPNASLKDPKWQAICKEYKDTTGRDAETTEEGGLSFSFNNKEEAISFFKGQAEQGRDFQVYDKEHDHCIYSDGKNFMHGTMKDVEGYKKNPEDFNLNKDGALSRKDAEPQYQAESGSPRPGS